MTQEGNDYTGKILHEKGENITPKMMLDEAGNTPPDNGSEDEFITIEK